MAYFKREQDEFNDELDKIVAQMAQQTRSIIVSNTPVDTGNLRSSIIAEQDDNGDWIVGTAVPYAEQVEIGMKPTVITPKNKQALKFNIGGQTVFAKKVNHPGFDGSHMFMKGVNWLESNAEKFFK